MAYSEWPSVPKAKLGPWGAQSPLLGPAADFQDVLRKFAVNTMRPLGTALDKLTAEEVVAKSSKFWEFWGEFRKLGITVDALMALPPDEAGVLFAVLFEEFGYGDSGLAISVGASTLPKYIAARMGRMDLAAKIPDDQIGCWPITEPDHGSDTLDPTAAICHPTGNYGRPNCIAKITDGKVIVRGQKSAWVSNGPVADWGIVYCSADTKAGPDPRGGVCVIVPMNSPGVSRGKPLEKMGQRALPQGEVFFDNVELDISYVLAEPKDYAKAVYMIHTEANSLMGAIFAGLARAAYDHAYEYAHERRQGGVPIIRHQSVATRIFHMFRKVEMATAMARRVISYNFQAPLPALQCGMSTKVTSTATAFEVASEALQIFGGNGMTREYPMEKLLRDARASMIEDGCNEVLAIKGGTYLMDESKLAEPSNKQAAQ
ncbi:MAG TPA: acyl-CoA dehydrogenase family protein [Rhodospirillaceae bacterium]|nr:acyl-CoA dehydrogenase family protein [Rhodospirillaceae bacterium]